MATRSTGRGARALPVIIIWNDSKGPAFSGDFFYDRHGMPLQNRRRRPEICRGLDGGPASQTGSGPECNVPCHCEPDTAVPCTGCGSEKGAG